MTDHDKIRFFHALNTRSSGVLLLLEELGVSYELHVLNMKADEQRKAKYLAINPMGKVPAILHGDALVTEQVAIFLYVAGVFPQAGFAPALRDPLRGPYLRWMVFYEACFEPAVVDRAQKREAAPPLMSPYGDFETKLKTLTDQLARGTLFARGERDGGRRALGNGSNVDDNVSVDSALAGDTKSYRTHRGPAGSGAGQGDRCRAGRKVDDIAGWKSRRSRDLELAITVPRLRRISCTWPASGSILESRWLSSLLRLDHRSGPQCCKDHCRIFRTAR